MLLVLLLVSCIGNSDITELVKRTQQGKDFLSAYPNADINAVKLSTEAVTQVIDSIRKDCDQSIPIKSYWKVKFSDPDTNTEMTSWIDAETQDVVCFTKKNFRNEKPDSVLKNGLQESYTTPKKSTTLTVKSSINSNFKQCEVKQSEISKNLAGEVFKVDENCLIEKAQTVEDCKSYEGKVILSYSGYVRNFKPEVVSNCIFKTVVKNNDFNRCSETGNGVSECYYQIALQTNDVTLCKNSDKDKIDSCYSSIAINKKDWKICEQSSDKILCFRIYAQSFTSGLCEKKESCNNCFKRQASKNIEIQACNYKELFGVLKKEGLTEDKLKSDKTICQNGFNIPSGSETNEDLLCMAGAGVLSRNTALCNAAGELKGDCYIAMVNTYSDFTLSECDKSGVIYPLCYLAVAMRNNNPEICYKLPEGNIEGCLNNMAMNTQTYSSCTQLIGNKTKACVQYFAPRIKPEEYTMQFCEDIKNTGAGGGPYPNQCFYEVATRTLNLDACDKISSQDREAGNRCKTIVEHVLNNKDQGTQLSVKTMQCTNIDISQFGGWDLKNNCYVTLVNNNPSFTLLDCDKTGIDYPICYIALALKNNDASICFKLSSGLFEKDSKEDCFDRVAKETKNLSSCAQIPEPGGWQCAARFVSSIKPEEYTMEFCEAFTKITGGPMLLNTNNCFYEVAKRTLNLDACNKINSANSKEECKTIVEHALQNK